MIGKIAGYVHDSGYIVIRIDGKQYYAHRLEWLVMTGNNPANEIDHVDGNRTNNVISNLREATRSQSMHNRKKHRSNTSSYVGVNWNIGVKKWQTRICCENTRYHLCYFDSAVDAAIERDKAAMRMHLKFARLNFRYEITRNNKIKALNTPTNSI